jgi:hypothetical protein
VFLDRLFGKSLFEIAFKRLKNIFNTQKVYLKKKCSYLVKKLKAFLRVLKV